MKPFQLAFLDITRRQLSSLIAICAIALAVCTVGVLYKLDQISQSRFNTLALQGDALIGAKSGGIEMLLSALNSEGTYPDYIPSVLYESLKQPHEIKFEDGTKIQKQSIEQIIPFLYFAKYKNYRAVGTDEGFFQRKIISDSISFQSGAWATGPQEIVIGAAIAKAENLKVGDSILLSPWIKNSGTQSEIFYKVTGIFSAKNNIWDYTLFSNINEAQSIVQKYSTQNISIWGSHVLNYFLVYLTADDYSALNSLVNQRTVAQMVSIPDQFKKLKDLTSNGETLGFLITIFIITLGGLCVAAILITRFESMNVQLAVLRAIGYQKKEIAQWLLWEVFLLSGTATLFGAGLDLLLFNFIQQSLGSTFPEVHSINLIWSSTPIWIVTMLATMLAVVIPMTRMIRQDIHTALKG